MVAMIDLLFSKDKFVSLSGTGDENYRLSPSAVEDRLQNLSCGQRAARTRRQSAVGQARSG
jgi:hypothetical protein